MLNIILHKALPIQRTPDWMNLALRSQKEYENDIYKISEPVSLSLGGVIFNKPVMQLKDAD